MIVVEAGVVGLETRIEALVVLHPLKPLIASIEGFTAGSDCRLLPLLYNLDDGLLFRRAVMNKWVGSERSMKKGIERWTVRNMGLRGV
jgi:hypothetical protein